MKTTSNLGLKKPEGTDVVDVMDFNTNADTLDSEIVKKATTAMDGRMSKEDKAKLDAATSAATASTMMYRDAGGRAKVAAPSAADDISRKDTVDAVQSNLNSHASLTSSAHGATSAATASTLITRDASGRAKVASPSAADDIARKDTVDTVQTNLTTHEAKQADMASTNTTKDKHISDTMAKDWEDKKHVHNNKTVLDVITGLSTSGGNNGTSTVIARQDHTHTAVQVGALATTDADTASTANKIVKRDASGNLKGKQIQSDVVTGTAPLSVSSTTMVANLNAQYLNGKQSGDFMSRLLLAESGAISGGATIYTFSGLDISVDGWYRLIMDIRGDADYIYITVNGTSAGSGSTGTYTTISNSSLVTRQQGYDSSSVCRVADLVSYSNCFAIVDAFYPCWIESRSYSHYHGDHTTPCDSFMLGSADYSYGNSYITSISVRGSGGSIDGTRIKLYKMK